MSEVHMNRMSWQHYRERVSASPRRGHSHRLGWRRHHENQWLLIVCIDLALRDAECMSIRRSFRCGSRGELADSIGPAVKKEIREFTSFVSPPALRPSTSYWPP